MKQSHYKWDIKKQLESNDLEVVLDDLKLPKTLAPLLMNRGITDRHEIESFIKPTVESLHDPFLFYDMDKTVERLHKAIETGELILIYGDYDADGITSTALIKEVLEMMGANVKYYLPSRFTDGYGPNKEVYKYFIDVEQVELILTVDNGVSGHEAISYATEQGVDVIVTDHHELPKELPEAYAIIHPRHPLGAYPYGDLAGVGVAFKLACALLGEIPMESLDLVAIGTIADLVSLTKENRALVKFGLDVMRQTERIGLHTLCQVGELSLVDATEETVGFGIAPRLNALGRLKSAMPGVELLMTFDDEEALAIANDIEQTNNERKDIVNKMTEEALVMINDMPKAPIYMLAKEGWHEGVLGIVASRIVEETKRPTLCLTINEQTKIVKGSGRSIGQVDLYKLLSEVSNQLISYGGHHMAAGISFNKAEMASIYDSLCTFVREIPEGDMQDDLVIDEVLSIPSVTVDFIEDLRILAPFGTDNPSPHFLLQTDNVEKLKQIGSDMSHLKFQLTEGGSELDCIAFGKGNQIGEFEPGEKVSVVGHLSINEWNGFRKPQLMVKDYQVDGLQIFDIRGNKSQSVTFTTQDPAYVVFEQDTRLTNLSDKATIYTLFDKSDEVMAKVNQHQEIVIVDCPYTLDLATYFFSKVTSNRLYLKAQVVRDHYLTGIPQREQFTKLFKFISNHPSVDVRHKTNEIAAHLKIDRNQLIFIINVFFDLGFVTIEDGLMEKVVNPINRSLEESTTYQTYLKKIDMEKLFLYSDVSDIKKWIAQQEEKK